MSSEMTRELLRQRRRGRLQQAFERIRSNAPAGWSEFLAVLEADAFSRLEAWHRDADKPRAECALRSRLNRTPPLLRRVKSAENLVLALEIYVTEACVG